VAAFIDVEGTFDHKWADLLGIDRTRLVYSRPEYAEQSLDILELLLRTQETDIIALDSIAFLTPQKEIEESNDKETMGVQPRVVGKAIRKLTAALNFVKNETSRSPTIFFTNQIRMKIGLVFGSPESNPGGLAPGFAATSEVRFNPIKIKMDEDTGRPLEGEVSFRVEKNKSDVPKIEGKYRLILTATEVKKKGEVYDEDWIAEQAHRHGIVTGSGAHWSCLGESFPAKSAIERRMLTDHAFKAKVRGAVMTAISLL
jgi:recombination protein RecA